MPDAVSNNVEIDPDTGQVRVRYRGKFYGTWGGTSGDPGLTLEAFPNRTDIVTIPGFKPDQIQFVKPAVFSDTVPPIRVPAELEAGIWAEYPDPDGPAPQPQRSLNIRVFGQPPKALLRQDGTSDFLLDDTFTSPTLYLSGWGPYPGTWGIRCFRRGRLGFVMGIITGAAVWRAGDVFFRLPWANPTQHTYISYMGYSSANGVYSNGAAYVAAGSGDVTTYAGPYGTINPPSFAAFNFWIDLKN